MTKSAEPLKHISKQTGDTIANVTVPSFLRICVGAPVAQNLEVDVEGVKFSPVPHVDAPVPQVIEQLTSTDQLQKRRKMEDSASEFRPLLLIYQRSRKKLDECRTLLRTSTTAEVRWQLKAELPALERSLEDLKWDVANALRQQGGLTPWVGNRREPGAVDKKPACVSVLVGVTSELRMLAEIRS